jgi:hypothetical protein
MSGYPLAYTMNIRSLPCLGSDCNEHHVTRRQEPSETALTVHCLTQGCHHQAVKTFQRLRLCNDMIFVDVPKCRHRVCSQCANRNLKMRIFSGGTRQIWKARRHPTALAIPAGRRHKKFFPFRKCGLPVPYFSWCKPVPYVSWCKKEPYSAGDVVVEQVSAHFGRFAVA